MSNAVWRMTSLQGQSYSTRLYSHPPLYPGEQIILQQDHMMCIDSFDNYAEGIIHLTTYRVIFTGIYAKLYTIIDKASTFEEDAEELSRNASRRQSITSKKDVSHYKNNRKHSQQETEVYRRQGRNTRASSTLTYSQSVRTKLSSEIPGYDDRNSVKLMTYRPMVQHIERINHTFDLELSVPCASIYEIRKYSRKNLPKGKSMFLCDGFELLCSNIKSHRFCLGLQSCYDSDSLIKLLLYHTNPSFSRLFAFAHRNAIMIIPSKVGDFLDCKDALNFYKFKDEYTRMGFATVTEWRVPSHSCEEYPKQTIVPSTIADEELSIIANFHRGCTFPALCWRQKTNGTVMLRSSTVLTRRGLLETRCEPDEKFLNSVCQTNESAAKNKLVVFTEQPKQSGTGLLNTPAQRMNNATGQLTPEQGETFYYANCKFVYTESPPDYKAVRQSAYKVQAFLATPVDDSKYLSSLEETEWLSQVSEMLQCATQAAVAMDCDRSSVLFSYDDGLDRTTQLASLTQILLDPFYRTVDGFQVLIQKEWLSFVHKFSDRTLPGETTDEHSPVFLQWLDGVWQITQQFPLCFEFNSSFLETIAESAYSCRFGDFIANSDQMKGIKEKTTSLWTWLNVASMSDPERFVNPRYRAKPKYVVHAIFPRYNIPCLKLWTSFYSSAYKQENIRDANKAGYIQSLKLEEIYKDLQRKYSKLARQLVSADWTKNTPSNNPHVTSDVSFNVSGDSDPSLDESCEDDEDSVDSSLTASLASTLTLESTTSDDGVLYAKRRMTRSRSLDDMLSFSNQKTIKRRSIKRKVGGSKFYTAELISELNREPRKRLEVPQPISETFTSLQDYLHSTGVNFSKESTVKVTDTHCSGYMIKRGQVHKNWRKRWFVLDLTKRCLAYFEHEKSQHPKGAISYQSITQVYRQRDTEKKKRCLFYVDTPGRTFAIQPPNERCMDIWMACLTIPPNSIEL
ncbi:hypothetical protein QZH41_008996 [Actinostola sp. cb2023]|nr:hypothetical protein QZH41_008996 [Actinostola sp. cb2023]